MTEPAVPDRDLTPVAALTARFLELGWLSRATGRALRATPDYDRRLDAWLGT